MRIEPPHADLTGGVAGHDRPGGNVLRHHGARADDCAFAERHARQHDRPAGDPRARADGDRTISQLHDRRRDVVARRAEARTLADRRVRAKDDRRDGVAVDAVGEAAVVAERQVPRSPDAHGREDGAMRADGRAERAQPEAAPAVEEPDPARERTAEQSPDELPQKALRPARLRVAVAILRQVKARAILRRVRHARYPLLRPRTLTAYFGSIIGRQEKMPFSRSARTFSQLRRTIARQFAVDLPPTRIFTRQRSR